jgi:GTP-binding protein
MRIAMIGLVNAGKSSLFNRFVKRIDASVTSSTPNTTRDWKEAVNNQGWCFVDTPGISDFKIPVWWDSIQPDLYVWVHDVSRPSLQIDRKIADLLRKTMVPVVVCLNKCDLSYTVDSRLFRGFETCLTSSRTGSGIPQLLTAIKIKIPETLKVFSSPHVPQYMILGQPNAGKSSLCNRLFGGERVVTSDVPGTTVDTITIDTPIGTVQDTPGLKRRRYDGFMSIAVQHLHQQLRRFHGVIIYMIDISQPLVSQDLRIARLAWDTGNPVLLLLNKCDLVDKEGRVSRQWLEAIRCVLPDVVPLLVSTQECTNLDKLRQRLTALHAAWSTTISTAALNRWCAGLTLARRAGVKYISQPQTCPPRLFVSGKRLTIADYRFLARKFREDFKLPGIPVQIDQKIY